MTMSIPLPSMHDPRAPGCGSRSQASGYQSSSNVTNLWQPLGQQPLSYLPPMQSPSGPQYHPPDQYSSSRQLNSHPSNSRLLSLPDSSRYSGPPPAGYPHPSRGSYLSENPQAPYPPPIMEAASRQRTSIACNFCRKRKVNLNLAPFQVCVADFSADSLQWIPECTWWEVSELCL